VLHLLVVGPFETRNLVLDYRCCWSDHRAPDGLVDACPLLAAMDLLVLPTYREGAYVLLEASAMGLPVVARVPGCVDGVEDNGTLVPARDPALLRAIPPT
jgi:glycosyltransferase involved in cell wall biosynthesis